MKSRLDIKRTIFLSSYFIVVILSISTVLAHTYYYYNTQSNIVRQQVNLVNANQYSFYTNNAGRESSVHKQQTTEPITNFLQSTALQIPPGSTQQHQTQVPINIQYDINPTSTLSVQSAEFTIIDQNGNPVQDAVVIIQGITEANFNTRAITDSNGQVSFSLNSQSLYQWTVYENGYITQSGIFLVIGNYVKTIQLSPVPPNQWYSFYKEDGNVQILMNSFDNSTVYNSGDTMSFQIEIDNIANQDINLDVPNTKALTIEASTGYYLTWWGSVTPSDIGLLVTLKPNGWIRFTSQSGINKICTGNSQGTRLDTGAKFDLSGSEFLCIDTTATLGDTIIPGWVPTDNYQIQADIGYYIGNIQHNISVSSQSFSITKNDNWEPQITSTPLVNATVGQQYTYTVVTNNAWKQYDSNFIQWFYTMQLVGAPQGMTIDQITKTISWIPTSSAQKVTHVKIIMYHTYFRLDPQNRNMSAEQEFYITVQGINDTNTTSPTNLYAYSPYTLNATVSPGKNVITQFKIVNNGSAPQSIPWKIDLGDGNSIIGVTSTIPPGKEAIVWTSFKYNTVGTYIPVLTINYNKTIVETDYNDDTLNLPEIIVSESLQKS